MTTPDDFSTYLGDLLSGTYDCVDRISLRGYYSMGQTSGGLLTWWNQLHPGVLVLREKVLKPVMAGVCRPKRGRPPKIVHALDIHYQNLQHEMLATLQTLKLIT